MKPPDRYSKKPKPTPPPAPPLRGHYPPANPLSVRQRPQHPSIRREQLKANIQKRLAPPPAPSTPSAPNGQVRNSPREMDVWVNGKAPAPTGAEGRAPKTQRRQQQVKFALDRQRIVNARKFGNRKDR